MKLNRKVRIDLRDLHLFNRYKSDWYEYSGYLKRNVNCGNENISRLIGRKIMKERGLNSTFIAKFPRGCKDCFNVSRKNLKISPIGPKRARKLKDCKMKVDYLDKTTKYAGVIQLENTFEGCFYLTQVKINNLTRFVIPSKDIYDAATIHNFNVYNNNLDQDYNETTQTWLEEVIHG